MTAAEPLKAFPAGNPRAHLDAERHAARLTSDGTLAHVEMDRDRDEFVVVSGPLPPRRRWR